MEAKDCKIQGTVTGNEMAEERFRGVLGYVLNVRTSGPIHYHSAEVRFMTKPTPTTLWVRLDYLDEWKDR